MRLKRCSGRAMTPNENIAIWAALVVLFLGAM
ncbi:hypothetical protein NYA22BAC_03075 [Parasphingorhabdus sp. NYA22]|jgi:hypothetical protein